LFGAIASQASKVIGDPCRVDDVNNENQGVEQAGRCLSLGPVVQEFGKQEVWSISLEQIDIPGPVTISNPPSAPIAWKCITERFGVLIFPHDAGQMQHGTSLRSSKR
jgi:hypothetical protein